MVKLEKGQFYTRDQIHDRLGGSKQEYLPHVNGMVVCGCLDPSKNPSAPRIVLPGPGPGIRRWAEVFSSQSHFVPVFLKRATNKWEYVGDYRVRKRSFDVSEIAAHVQRSGRPNISQVLLLEAAR